MKPNLGTKDRVSRIILAGFVAVAGLLAKPELVKFAFFALALFVLFEALASWCLVYAILGKNSCPVKLKYKNAR